jgi:hypothetical protein
MHVAEKGELPADVPAAITADYRLGFRDGYAGEVEMSAVAERWRFG